MPSANSRGAGNSFLQLFYSFCVYNGDWQNLWYNRC